MTEGHTDIARTRQGLYRFLGAALTPPVQDQFDMLSEAVDVLGDRDVDSFAFSPYWRRFGCQFPVDVVANGLDVDYVRLFASGMAGRVSPPSESHYRVQMRGGDSAEFVAALQSEYHSMGIGSIDGEEAPDHITTELEVMARLCDREARAWAEDQGATIEEDRTPTIEEVLELESQFLRRHLTVWIPRFRDLVRSDDPSPFYVDLVEMVHAFVIHDRDYVQLLRMGMSE